MAEEWPGISNSATEEKVKESVPLQIPNEQLSSTVSLEEERQNKRLKCSSHDKKQYVNQDQYSIQQEDCRPLHDSTNHTVTLSPNKKPAPSEKEDHSASTDLSDDDNVWLEFDDIGLPSLLNQIDNSVSTTASSLPTTEMLLQQTEKTLYSFGGFKSAGSKKNVAPSKQAFLTASRAVYRLLSEPKDSFPADLSQATATTVSSTPPLTDDSTATSPLVKRSPNSIALAPAPSDTCVSIPGQSRPATTLQCAPDTSSCQYEEYIQNFGGFRTAGSKRRSIHVSDEARLHAASIFAPITTPTILTQAPQCSSRPSLNDASTSHLEPNHSFLFSAQELLSISRRPVENQKVNEVSKADIQNDEASTSGTELSDIYSNTDATTASTSIVLSEELDKITNENAPPYLTLYQQPAEPIPSHRGTVVTSKTSALQKQRRAIKPFKSPTVDLELAKAGLENRSRASIRIKGPSVFNLAASSCRRPLSTLGKPKVYSNKELLSMNIPADIIQLSVRQARMYTFSPKWTSDDAYEALLEAGALPSLLTKTWVSNHYGWIVWKLALRIRQFPWEHVPDGKFQWSPTHVINQLLYRYEREINMGQRSVIKRIMEHDDTPTKPMVLMVADIVAEVRNDGSKAYRLQLTDGWYQISAALDNRLEMMLDLQRLYIGQKIMIVGAQLQHGSTATSPLSSLVTTDEKHDRTSTALLLSANSCLPCAWDWKLGYQRQRRRQVRRIDDNVYEDGGVVTMLEIIICKKYPMMYSETLASGASQIRSSKEEEFVRLSLDQLQNKSPLERNVSGYFRLRICDISTRKKTLATLLISQATEFTHSALIEGNAYRLFFVQPYQPKFKNHIGLHLRTTRLTSWEQIVPPSTTTYPLRSISLCIDMKSVSDTDTDMVVYVLDAHDPLQTKRNCNISLWRQKLLVTDRSMAICQVVVNSFSRPAYIVPGQIICLLNVRCALHDSKYDITHIKTSDETEVIAKSTDCRHRDMVPELKHWAETAKEDMNRVKSRLGAIQSKPRIL